MAVWKWVRTRPWDRNTKRKRQTGREMGKADNSIQICYCFAERKMRVWQEATDGEHKSSAEQIRPSTARGEFTGLA